MVLIRGLHVTTKRHLPRILRTGLEPRVPSEHNWPNFVDQPKGVYLSPIGNDKIWYRATDVKRYVILQVHFCGPCQHDPVESLAGCLVSFRPIQPHMIKHVIENALDPYPIYV